MLENIWSNFCLALPHGGVFRLLHPDPSLSIVAASMVGRCRLTLLNLC